MRGRLSSLQAARGLAVGAVLLFHLRHICSGGPGEALFPACWVHLQGGVDLFFVISGYVMVYTSLRPSGPPMPPLSFLLRRVERIYPLYWLVTLAILGAVAFAPGTAVLRSPLTAGRLAASLLLWPQASSPILGQGWSLVHEMYFYLVFALLLALVPCHAGRALLAWGAAVLAGAILCGPFSNTSPPLLRTCFHPLTFEFIAGAALALAHDRGFLRGGPLALVAAAAVAALALLRPEFPMHGWSRALAYGIPAALLVHGLVAAERGGRPPGYGWLARLGDASYSIYLVQMAVLVGCQRALWSVLGRSGGGAAQVSVAAAAGLLALVAGFGVSRWIEAPLLRGTRRLIRPGP
jgi:peptidoglycan/LPS O-acetylase OafA/YrhL